ncbi:hypothetical protein [uncultured Psychroserpens sp.]|uniref:hypothetical protein n=1 Tax=uncultured Psychroserpens sp. TaxID=255436 RepID=UPI00260DC1C1|nr:hypothetical protein [uncultured Psychroserpens sp.]
MSKLVAILLSSLVLVQSLRIDYDDIAQLDELIEHAQFHQAEYGDNFLVFISKHYGELKDEHSQNHQEEKTDHEQLPFQCQDHMVVITAFVIQAHSSELEVIELFEMKDSNFYYRSSLSTLHKKGLFQPPIYA